MSGLKAELERLLADAIGTLVGTVLPEPIDASAITLERTRDAGHGDYASSIALKLARSARKPPREIAAAIVAALPASAFIARAEVGGAGFINLYLAQDAHTLVLTEVLERGALFGKVPAGHGEKILLEFVSANPTGPLHVGHGRQAAYGATLANLLRAVGHEVAREYYINDAGRQMDILAVSTWLRYLERCGETLPFPANGYRGDYVNDIAAQLEQRRGRELHRGAAQVLADLPLDAPAGDKEQYIDALIARMRALLGAGGFDEVLALALAAMLGDIREDLTAFGVEF